jgi:hypothetical protein
MHPHHKLSLDDLQRINKTIHLKSPEEQRLVLETLMAKTSTSPFMRMSPSAWTAQTTSMPPLHSCLASGRCVTCPSSSKWKS